MIPHDRRDDELVGLLERRRAAILVVDLVESVRLFEEHEEPVALCWTRFVRHAREQVLPDHEGRLVKSLGDGLMVEFDDPARAVQCAFDLHRLIDRLASQAQVPMRLRAGVNADDVIVGELDLYGAGVNLAARLAGVGEAGDTIVSAGVRDVLVPGLDAEVEDLGPCHLKHVSRPVQAFRVAPAAGGRSVARLPPRVARRVGLAIAVLPFPTQAARATHRIMGDVLCEELTRSLARSRRLRVVSHLSTAAFRRRAATLDQIRETLQVDYVLGGRVTVDDGGHLRLAFELTDVAENTVIHAGAAGERVEAVLHGTADLVTSVAEDVHRRITDRVTDLALTRLPVTLDGRSILLGATMLMHRARRADFDRARGLLEHLCEREPGHSDAYAWLAKWHVLKSAQGWSSDRQADGDRAIDLARRAIDRDPHSALALSLEGLVHAYLRRDLARAEQSYRAAIDENHSEPLAWLFMSTLHAYAGQGADAAESAERALLLSPLDPLGYFFDSLAATALLANGETERALGLATRSIHLNRAHASTWRVLVIAQVLAGRLDEARGSARELVALEPEISVARFLERFPGRDGPLAQPWGHCLEVAGIPRQ
jgi:class 3 adenylate cyclase/Flp pilus assembly protein TadD